MKILQVNKFWYGGGRGADIYCLNLTHALEEEGHEVARFGMEHPENEPSPWNAYFVPRSDYATDKPTPAAAFRFIYNRRARKQFAQLVQEFQPDVIHLHNIYHQLTTSLLPVARKSGARVVMTMHDYKALAPNYSLFAAGAVTEATKKHRYYRVLSRKASDESFPRRALLMLEAYYTWLTGAYTRNIDTFIAPAQAMKRLAIEYGIQQPIEVILNWINVKPARAAIPKNERKPYVLYASRLSAEKGIATLCKAAELLPKQQFVVIGSGTDVPEVFPPNVEYRGLVPHEQVVQAMKECHALIVPSEWYEVNSLVIPEAHAMGTWVIAAQTGTIDVLQDGKNGWWFEMGNAQDLAAKIAQLQNADTSFEPFVHISREAHLQQVLDVYRRGVTIVQEPVYTGLPAAPQTQKA